MCRLACARGLTSGPRGLSNTNNRDMMMRPMKVALTALAVVAAAAMFNADTVAQTAPSSNAAPTADNAVMLTIFLKHDQTRPLGELNAELEKHGFYKAFPPPGVEGVSWDVVM